MTKGKMMMRWRSLWVLVFFLLSTLSVLPVAYGKEYIESIVWQTHATSLTQDNLILNIKSSNGPGSYTYNIFYSNCSTGADAVRRVSYLILPKIIKIGNVNIPISWTGSNVSDINDEWVAAISATGTMNPNCVPQGTTGGSSANSAVNTNGSGRLDTLEPGTYSYSLTYYVGNAFAATDSDVVNLIKSHGLRGAPTSTPPIVFTGIAACAQDNATPSATIDFGTVISNGTVQPGPSTVLGLACNYDIALNNVTYSLTSNNPVSGEPNTGQEVVVGLTNGATVQLNGENVTKPDPKKVRVNINPSIDTRGATAGEGAGSATLTFSYQ